jgi:osmotically-inducible protein OsmY
MRTDAELKTELLERFDAIPSIDASDIDILVDHGVVTLIGEVDTHQTRFELERAAKLVPGIRALQIHINPTQKSSDRSRRHALD